MFVTIDTEQGCYHIKRVFVDKLNEIQWLQENPFDVNRKTNKFRENEAKAEEIFGGGGLIAEYRKDCEHRPGQIKTAASARELSHL